MVARIHRSTCKHLVIPQKSARPREAVGWTKASQRSFAALRMTKPLDVILSAAKDL